VTTATARPVRPANRRDLIVEAAGRAFSERGYHAVAMDDIAASVGITAAALYRHFPNKYALFAHCAQGLAQGLVDTLDGVPPDADLDTVLAAVARTTVANRSSGGLYRWEARYLEKPERDALRSLFARVADRVTAVVADARGVGPTDADARLAAAAALGAVGSATTHRTTVGARRMETLLAEAAGRVALTHLPAQADAPAETPSDAPTPSGLDADAQSTGPSTGPSAAPATTPARRGHRREEILRAAIPLFHRDGYTNVSMGAIAHAVGLTPSAIYRHYEGKGDILLAACLEAADLLQGAVDAELAGASTPQTQLRALATAYVGYSFGHTELTSVAEAELGGLAPAVQRPLRAAQRDHVGQWEERLLGARPDLDRVGARVLVHAGLGVVAEAGRRLHWADSPANRARVVALVLSALAVPAPEVPGAQASADEAARG
jgi:AcrR family transcriptional regulator